MIQQVYLDFNASTPIAPEVSLAMQSFANHAYGNPSSLHWAGVAARDAIDLSRSQVAALLGCDATEVIFTSGGTESNNFAIQGLFFDCLRQGRLFHAITSRIEHPAVLEPFRFIESLGGSVTYLAVDPFGSIDPDEIHTTIRTETACEPRVFLIHVYFGQVEMQEPAMQHRYAPSSELRKLDQLATHRTVHQNAVVKSTFVPRKAVPNAESLK